MKSPSEPAAFLSLLHPTALADSSSMSSSGEPGVVDPTTAKMLEADKGKTTEAMRNDREAKFPSGPSAGPQQATGLPSWRKGKKGQEDPALDVPKGFDPYMMNGRGPNDSRLENIKGRPQCSVL